MSTGVVNARVIPGKLDVRISIINQHRDDWVHNDYTGGYDWRQNLEGYNDIAARFQALYHFDDSFTLLFEADVRHLEGTATLFRANIIQKGSNGLVPGFDPAQIATDGDNYQNVNTRGGHVTLHKDFEGYGIDFISAYEHAAIKSRGDIDGGYVPAVPFDVETATITPAVDQFTEELRLSANDWGRLFNQAGVYYFHEYIDNYDQDFSPVGQLTTQANERQSTESVGLFDSASYRLTDRLKIQGGVRYTSDFRTFDAVRQFGGDGFLSLGTKADAANVSWDASVVYALTSSINAYFRAATGYLEPSIQGRITDENYLSKAGAETTTSYEVGLKGAMLHRRAIFTADAYMWDTKNLQLTASGGTEDITELVNAKKAIGQGLETDAGSAADQPSDTERQRQLQFHRDRGSEPRDRLLRRWLHGAQPAGSAQQRPGLHQRKSASQCAAFRTERYRSLRVSASPRRRDLHINRLVLAQRSRFRPVSGGRVRRQAAAARGCRARLQELRQALPGRCVRAEHPQPHRHRRRHRLRQSRRLHQRPAHHRRRRACVVLE